MKTNNVLRGLGMLSAGVGIGAAIGFLYAPQSGRQTRKLLSRAAEDGADLLPRAAVAFAGRAERAFERGKDLATRLVA